MEEKKEEKIEVQKEKEIATVLPVKPENKIIDFNSIDKILAILSDDNLLTPIFYESFISEIKNYDAVFLNGEKSNKKFSKYLKKINKNINLPSSGSILEPRIYIHRQLKTR